MITAFHLLARQGASEHECGTGVEAACCWAVGSCGAGSKWQAPFGAAWRPPLPPLLPNPAAQSTFTTPLGRAVYSFFFDAKQRGMGVPVHELFLPK